LAGRTALVTGGARRLGRAIAEHLATHGARVAVHYHTGDAEAAEVVAGIRTRGGEAEAFAGDLRDPGALAAVVAAVTQRLGAIDVLVNNASVYRRTPFAALDVAAWDENLAVNLTAPYLLSLEVGRAMQTRGAGKIVNLTDTTAERPHPDYVPYGVAKAGLVALSRGLARALAPQVQVNCVAPGPVLPPADATPALRASVLARTPANRFGHPDDVAAAVLYLVEASTFVTGTTVVVDGGRGLT
jgi:NAD(P)-dependent dehydrogenase (short-subunit alcohol dehydrogenase family)